MPVAHQSASVLSKVLSGGGANYGVPGAWSQSMFGSGWPIAPVTAPKDIEIPRSIDFPISVNATLAPRTSYGLMPFASLLEAYENVAECKSPVLLIQRELNGLIPHLVDADGNVIEDHPYNWMTEMPDRKTPFGVWLTRFIKSMKVYDAPAVYLERNNSGAINGLHYIDGSTLFVIVDQFGNTPAPEPIADYVRRISGQPDVTVPQLAAGATGKSSLTEFVSNYIDRQNKGQAVPVKIPAYTQVIKGTPFSWWSADDIWYMPESRRMNAPYGESFIEMAWSWIMIIVNLTAFELGHYRTGNMPEGFATLPRDLFGTMEAILAGEMMVNQRMTNNPPTERNRIRFFPDGTKYFPTKKPDFPDQLYKQAWNNILNAIGEPPSEFGDIPGKGLGGKGFKEGSASDFGRRTLNPHRRFIASLFNMVLKQDGVDDVTFSLDYALEEIDPDKKSASVYEGMAHGTLSLNDALGELGLNPVGDPADKDNIANKHLIVAGASIFVIEDMDTQNGMAVPMNAPVAGGAVGGAVGGKPVDPETAVEQDGKQHDPKQDAKTLQTAIKNMLATGTLDGHFISVPSGAHLAKSEPNDTRISQTQAEYIPTASNPTECCAKCQFFVAGGSCQKVQGSISPDGWCKLFEAKPAPPAEKLDKVDSVTPLAKFGGVDPEDDDYYGAPISRDMTLPLSGGHANSTEIVAMCPDGLPPKAALWKAEGGESAGMQTYIGGAQYLREEAAYLLDRSLGFFLAPLAYVAESNDELGAAVMYSPGAPLGKAHGDYDPAWLEKAAVFDYISGQTDRGSVGHNYLTHSQDETRPVLYDNGLSFPASADRECNSGFCNAQGSQPVSDSIMQALVMCKGDASCWTDIANLVGKDAAALAMGRLQKVIDAKCIAYTEDAASD